MQLLNPVFAHNHAWVLDDCVDHDCIKRGVKGVSSALLLMHSPSLRLMKGAPPTLVKLECVDTPYLCPTI